MAEWQKGDAAWCYINDDVTYEAGKIVELGEDDRSVTLKLASGKTLTTERANVLRANKDKQDGVEDNTFLRELNEATILHNVGVRYAKSEGGIYSTTGHILIAVNPFRQLKIYEEAQIKRYLGKPIGSEPPHIYAIADRMYRLLLSSGDSQAIIVSGPSGAGKTETCKLVLKHLAYVTKHLSEAGMSKSSMELGALLVMTNPLLEAFGNAETNLNRNSSRFGKFTQIHVSKKGAILGASIQTYLLEATRVVVHAERNCNYHIFYQIVAGLSSSEKASCQLESDANKYAYLRNATGKATARPGGRVGGGGDAAEFKDSLSVLQKIGVSEKLIASLWETLSGLLALGNITYGETVNGDACIQNTKALGTACKLLQCHDALLQQGLTSRTLKLKGGEMQVPLKQEEAESARDALAKAVYGKLFSWIVTQINTALIDKDTKLDDTGFLGILDIYGFENFERNSLEQLLINFTNEQLHQHFAIALFKTEQEIYKSEGIVWPGVEWEDNTACLEAISGKGGSIFNLLTEHSRLPKSSDASMTEGLLNEHRKSKHISPPKMGSKGGRGTGAGTKLTGKEAFVIAHFAGSVMYQTAGWLKKNTDSLHEDLSLCMSSSSAPILKDLFSVGSINAFTGGSKGGGKRAGFVADKYQKQLDDLMRTLRATSSHFVRCIKPNHKQEPNMFNKWLVLDQLRNSGMVDAVRLLSSGYSVRIPFTTLEESFKPLCPDKFKALSAPTFATCLLTALDLGRTDFLVGLTKAFFKSTKLAFVDALMDGTKKLEPKFFKKMARVLALYRFRRAIAAVRSLIYLMTKMRRQRALKKLRQSALVASAVGRSIVRRAKDIRFGNAVTMMQKSGRGSLARAEYRKRKRAVCVIQSSGRGIKSRRELKVVRDARKADKKKRAMAERNEQIRKHREELQARALAEGRGPLTAEDMANGAFMTKSHTIQSNRMMLGAHSAAQSGLKHTYSGGVGAPRRSAEQRRQERREFQAARDAEARGEDPEAAIAEIKKAYAEGRTEYLDEHDRKHGVNPAEDEDSDGSDMAMDSDEEEELQNSMLADGRYNASKIQNPKDLLAATAALDYKSANRTSSGGYDFGDEDAPHGGSGGGGGRHMSKMSRLKASTLGSALGSARRRSDMKLVLSKTAKGSIVTAARMKVRKTADASWTDRYAVVVGDVLLVFMLQTAPDLPLGLRLWPSQVVCLKQSTLADMKKVDIRKDASFSLAAQVSAMGGLQLQAEDLETMQRFAVTMLLGVSNVTRSRQQAKLKMAQQLFHEKKLSLLKTQHMIELLHKSQEMFFEAGSGQFDDCNAVCMHSGTMRQSLIDVTPFMPVSDFICEYCSCVIIPEEEAEVATQGLEAQVEMSRQQVESEKRKKMALDEETLEGARDVRILRQRRQQSEQEALAKQQQIDDAMAARQKVQAQVAEMRMYEELPGLSSAALGELKAALQEQLAAAQRERNRLRDSLKAKQARAAGKSSDLDPEDEIKQQQQQQQARADGRRQAPSGKPDLTKKGSSLTRILSFNRKNSGGGAPSGAAPSANGSSEAASSSSSGKKSVAGSMIRKLSFSKKKESSK